MCCCRSGSASRPCGWVSGWGAHEPPTHPGAVRHQLPVSTALAITPCTTTPGQRAWRLVVTTSAAPVAVVATAGALFLGSGYEQRLTLEVWEGGARVSTETYEDRGDVLYHALTGQPMFKSTVRPGLEFTGEYLYENGFPTGELAVTQRVVGGGGAVPVRGDPPAPQRPDRRRCRAGHRAGRSGREEGPRLRASGAGPGD